MTNRIVLLMLSILLVALIAWVTYAYFIDDRDTERTGDEAQSTAPPATATSCDGKWFDTHVHLDDESLPVTIAERMKEHRVGCAVLFVQMDPEDFDEDSSLVRETLGDVPNVFVPFFDVVKDKQSTVTTADLTKIDTAFSGMYKGFGEFALYRPDIGGTDITGDPWKTIYSFAGEKKLVVMMHIGMNPTDLIRMKAVMTANPNTTFLIHGFELGPEGYIDLLKAHPNMYYTLDTATYLKFDNTHLMYPEGNGSAATFVRDFDVNKSKITDSVTRWSQVVLAVPDRVLWGTDVSYDWHTDDEVYSRLVATSTELMNLLPADTRDKFAYRNAVTLFGPTAPSYPRVND